MSLRSLCLAIAFLLAGSVAAAEPHVELEASFGYGVVFTQGAHDPPPGKAVTMFSGGGLVALREVPSVAAYGGVLVETEHEESALGAMAGLQVTPGGGHFHVAAGGVYLGVPGSRWGASVSAGECFHVAHHVSTCGELELTEYFAGASLDDGERETLVEAVVGFVLELE